MGLVREIIGAKIWASGAADPADRTSPSLSEIVAGWPSGQKPPRQWFNWLDYVQHLSLAFFEQEGFFLWDTNIPYQKFGIVRASDDVPYISLTDNNSGNDPAGGADPVNWQNYAEWLIEQSGDVPSRNTYLKLIESTSAEAIAGEITLQPGTYDIHAIGSGGGGGGFNTSIDGQGGGGGAAAYSKITLITETTIPLSIGIGGAGATATDGGDGGDTSFDYPSANDILAKGGLGGKRPTSTSSAGAQNGGSAALSSGDITFDGMTGQVAQRTNITNVGTVSGHGAKAGGPYGGQNPSNNTLTPQIDGAYGAGGAGSDNASISQAGVDGVIIIIGV